ncbi:EAL domain-containing protein [Thauera sp. Sel9]|uniref:EAL domain-containing protein n=1 Tax=Thauera sp. Sel9 TaxID=2974299 RepID=UPI0021E13BFA|nr:EAL domain-containing protein [Thauera sp. Sel9]MCV2217097.1 EAL domain-containing protein [Thauera sp. Sel9]
MPLTELVHYFNKHSPFALADSNADCLEFDGKRARAHFAGYVLDSLFQPLKDSAGGRVIGHEAHLRICTDAAPKLPAQAVFLEARTDTELVRLDRLARTLHALNFLLQRDQTDGTLWLNVHPRLIRAVPEQHGQIFESVLSRCGLTPERVVLELTDDGLADPAPLTAAITEYKERNYRIAIDNFGRHSNDLDRLAALGPDIVKLDRSLSRRAQAAPAAANLVAGLRRRSIRVVAQHVETAEQARHAKELGVDWLQGSLPGEPAPDCRPIARPGSHRPDRAILDRAAPGLARPGLARPGRLPVAA